MLTTVLTQGAWRCLSSELLETVWLSQGLEETGDITGLIDQFRSLPITLKDNHRSTVKRGELWGRQVVAKRPVDKNRRPWMRLSSLFVASEAAATVENLAKMHAAGIQSVKPLFALEKRVLGMVVDSWVCYEYREGTSCNEDDLPAIVDFLHQMHTAGFRHDDPTWNNFLIDNDDVLFTIDTKAKPCRNEFHVTNDFTLLRRDNDLGYVNLVELGGLNRSTIGYWLSVSYFSLKSGRSWLKSKIKKNRPRNRDS